EHDGTTGAVQTDYILAGKRTIARVSNGTTSYFLNDRMSLRLMLDGSANVAGTQSHLPFGEDFAEIGTQEKHHLSTYEHDSESGTDYALNRQYAPGVGRFLRIDPMPGRALRPQRLNRYTYVLNDPINLGDPEGLDEVCIFLHQDVDRVETVDAEGHADWDVYLTNVYACGYVKNQPTGGGGADAGGGELPQNPCGDSVLSGEGTLTMLLQAIDDATAGLDKQACKDLFQGRDAAKFLGDLFGGG